MTNPQDTEPAGVRSSARTGETVPFVAAGATWGMSDFDPGALSLDLRRDGPIS
jgi:hypothetical protein